jgi:hypothetical protein
MRTGTSILLALALAVIVGCEKTDTGGPGKTTAPTIAEKVTGQKDTFTIKGESVSVTQGAKEQLEIPITRHTGFDQAVMLTFEPPAQIMVKDEKGAAIKQAEIKKTDSKATVYIEAAADAGVGDNTIKVTAKPEAGGDAAHVTITVKVKAK